MLAVTGAAVLLGCGVTAAMSRESDLERAGAFAAAATSGSSTLDAHANVDALGYGVSKRPRERRGGARPPPARAASPVGRTGRRSRLCS